MRSKWIPIPNAPLEVRYVGPKWLARLLCLHFGGGSINLGKRLQAPVVRFLCRLFGCLGYREEIRLGPVERINAEYDRLEFDLRQDHERQLADLCKEYQWRLQDLRQERVAELAGVENVVVSTEQTEHKATE